MTARYTQLDIQFSEFYDSVADDVALRDENKRLNKEIDLMKLSLEELSELNSRLNRERIAWEEERLGLNTIIIELRQKVRTLTDELSAVKNRLGRVMDFIKENKLSEKLDRFLHPIKNRKK